MSKITNDGLTGSGIVHFVAVPIWHQRQRVKFCRSFHTERPLLWRPLVTSRQVLVAARWWPAWNVSILTL